MIHNIQAQSNHNHSLQSQTAAEKVRSTFLGNNTESAANSHNEPYKRHLFSLLKTASDHLPDFRISTCQKIPTMAKNPDGTISEAASVAVGISDNGQCKYGGLSYCGSIWLCPLCARMVAPSRIAEIKHAMSENAKAGGQSVFVTFTQPHYITNELSDLIKIQAKALSKMKSTRNYKELVAKYGFIGEIRAFEITYGKNGWHPHIHAVYLFENITINKDIEEFTSKLSGMWAQWVLRSGGRLPNNAHGVDVRLPRKGDTDEIAAYIGKWGEELTMSHTKESKNGSLTPFQLLEMLNLEYNYQTYALIKEYAHSTKGRARLFWSRGLKNHFNMDEFSDQELAELPAKTHLFDISWGDYKILRTVGLAGDVLDLSQTYPVNTVQKYIACVVELYNDLTYKENLEFQIARQRIQALSRIHIESELLLLGHYS